MSNSMLPDGVTITHPDKLWIGGAWTDAQSGATLELVSPDTEEVCARVAEAGPSDMDAAASAARQAFDEGPWPRMPLAERLDLLRKMAAILESRTDELARCYTAQVGGLASFATPMTVGSTMTMQQIIGIAESYPFIEKRPSPVVDTALVVQEPVGVVAAVTPWNAPYGIMLNKVTYALAAGCTVVMKPAPETPLEAYIIAEAAEAVGLPPGVLNLACGGTEASDHLVSNPAIDKVSFTGSTTAGKRIASVCADRIARCTLELGGKSAAIVLDDFPVEAAAGLLANTICVMCGQVCAMLSRALVPRSRHDELADAIAAVMRDIRVGRPDDPDARIGPLAMKRQYERVLSYIEDGKQSATLVTGGSRPEQPERGYYIEPTLFASVDNQSRIAQEEIFGPVLCLIPYDDEDDAVRIANESSYGLSGSVLTSDADAAYRIARRIRTGVIGQNGMRMDFGQPYGGFKQSGIGREGGTEGLESFLEVKSILLDAEPSAL